MPTPAPSPRSDEVQHNRRKILILLAALVAAGLVIWYVIDKGGVDQPQPQRMITKLKLSTPETLPPAGQQPVVPVSDGRVDRAPNANPTPAQTASNPAPQFDALVGVPQSATWTPPAGTQDTFASRAVRVAMKIGGPTEPLHVSGWWFYKDSNNLLRMIDDVTVVIVGKKTGGGYTVKVKATVWNADGTALAGEMDLGEKTLTPAP